jgi:hypothetical protein
MAETTSSNFNGGAVAPGSSGSAVSFVSKAKTIPYADFGGSIEFSGSVENFNGYCEVSFKPTTTGYALITVYARASAVDPWAVSCAIDAAYPNIQSHITLPVAVNGVAEIKLTLVTGPLDSSSNIIGYLKGFELKE